MSNHLKHILILLCFFAIMPTSVNANECSDIATLEKLIGDWKAETSDSLVKESWAHVSNHTFEGAGIFYDANGQLLSAESLRIVEMSGEIFYIAKVAQNQLPTSFKLTACTGGQLTFENPDHDFPKKLTYHFLSSTELHVTVEGDGEGFELNFIKENEK